MNTLDDHECHEDCGMVNTDIILWSHPHFFSPHDWVALQEVVMHVLGLIPTNGCEVCWNQKEN